MKFFFKQISFKFKFVNLWLWASEKSGDDLKRLCAPSSFYILVSSEHQSVLVCVQYKKGSPDTICCFKQECNRHKQKYHWLILSRYLVY